MAGNLTAMIASIFSGSAVSTDPYFNLTTLLLSTTATNGQQNNTFLDSSTNNFTITRNPATGPNAPTQGTFSPFSQTGWVNYFNGSYLTVPAGADFNLGTNDFCIEFWLNPIAPATYGGILSFDNNGDYPLNFSYASANSSNLQANFGTTTAWLYTAFFDTSTATNAWAHYVATRSGSTFRLFKNGVLKATGTSSGTIGNSSSNIYINGNSSSAGTTYISNLRIINGSIPTAYQTSSTTTGTTIFTVPTSPLTTTSQGATAADVKLLTCQSNRFVDNSTANPKTISVVTANSTPTVVPFSPFNPTSAWSASTVGGSGYFDGTGDYLNTPATGQFAPTGNFTIRLWFYLTSLAATNHLIGNYTTNAATDWLIEVINTGVIQVFTNGSTLRLSHSGVTTNQWYYLTITRSGTTITGQVNGSNFNTTATYTQSGTFGSATKAIYIGQRAGSTNPLFGYLSSVSLVDGSALQTVPTAPLTNESGTQLLLNFTNSGIYDATAKNVLETVGNAQVSTAQSKWAPTSMLFNGTTDYLQVNTASDLYNLSSGNWTIEAWVYRTGTNQMAVMSYMDNNGASLNGWGVEVNRTTAGTLYFGTYNASSAFPSTSIKSAGNLVPSNVWTYIAVTCVGTTVTLYVNGTSVATGTRGTVGNNANCRLRIGALNYTTVSYWQGYIQDPRITKGYARTIATPTEAFPVQ